MFSVSSRRLAVSLCCALLLLTELAAGVGTVLAQPAEGQVAREYTLIFTGNQAFSEGRLRQAAAEELAALARTDFPAATADDAAFQMELAYKREGYAFAVVSYHLSGASEGATLEFSVSEGVQVIVEGIEFSGNTAFDRETLLAFFEGETTGFLGLNKLLFVETDISAALSAIRDLYLGAG
ncbi:MAG: hypothetical protein KKD53_08435, partial [Proteobacteria bacterium]|nr:hypothetical protein [Pseudomonadota bacterium]